MRTIVVRDNMRIPLGKQGENNAVRVVWPKIAEKYAKLYGDGRFELVVVQKGKAYPAVVSVDGTDLVWGVLAADVATAEVGSLELIYYVGDTIAKSQTWETIVVASKSADGMTEPPEDPARAWFDEIKRQIGDLNKLTTNAKENLVAAINEAARTGSGGGTVEMRVDGGYIQYSTDGVTWENLIAVASLEGKPGKDGEPGAPGAPGKDGEPGKDGHTPKIAATKTGKTTSITADGVEIAKIEDGADAASDFSLGITGATVGQIAKITAVDTDGKPTAWEPVDMAGGGGGETWEILVDTALAESVESVTYTFDNCKRIKALIAPVIASGEPFSGWTRITINNVSYPVFNSRIDNTKGIYIEIASVYTPYVQASIGTNSNTTTYGFIGGIQTTALENIAPDGVTEFGCQTAGLLKAGTRIKIWGVKS
nr:MAG TPA: collagen triple helix repeat protein [Bacteriophage sp.]